MAEQTTPHEWLPYLEAYAAHSDERVLKDPHEAVGGQWESIGQLQFNFLIAKGLTPESKMLDIGCGTLRGGRHFIRHLDSGNYTGTDISARAIEYARQLIEREGLADKVPTLVHRRSDELFFLGFPDAYFDFLLAQSVFTHLPDGPIERCVSEIGRVMSPEATFFFTFRPTVTAKQKDGRNFSQPQSFYVALANRHGFHFHIESEYAHPRGQIMGAMRQISRA